jgi:hypothetical protein
MASPMSKTPPELIRALRRFEPDVQSLVIASRAVVLEEIGPSYESIFPIKKIVSVLYSTTEKRMKDNVCLLVIYRDHVNLMFPGEWIWKIRKACSKDQERRCAT